jgi:hypothetical protein
MKLISKNCHSEKKRKFDKYRCCVKIYEVLSEEIEKNVRENLKGFFYGFIAFLIKM